MSTGNERKTKTVQSVDRSLAILEALARHREPIALTVLSVKLGLNISTVHRLLNTLIVAGFVEQEPNQGRYRLGLKTFEIGNAALYNLDIRSIAKPYLKELVDRCNETANLSVLNRGEVVYIDQVESPNIVKMFAKPGTRGPAYCTASGKVLLASLPPGELNQIVKKNKFYKYTDRTITDSELFKKELAKVKQQNYAIDFGELEEGVQCVAAPVRNHEGKTIAAISVSGPATRISQSFPRAELIKLIIEAANRISLQLGFYR
ncbi:IclR family transcriptional regulator [Desulfallas thermosapovorans]|uniref:Glycerol operon regulatory protein n=1 Tax=Desulfallas thermosapovorans DSM 6562 TaxID=1121431 RepID=A0A5S4ZTC8_9FIRM|nr:IclR family transcriptional regulator [Desulfallas thermosapovorans]TYO96205.1 IclR family transcriptional regulator [Desulfallas thermosapovorans DSM 6562]